MKMSNLILLFALPIAVGSNFMVIISKAKIEKSFNYKFEKNNENDNYQKWYNSKKDVQITKLKDNLIKNIFLKNNKIIFKKENIDKNLWLEKYEFLVSKKYENSLNFLYKIKLLEFIDGRATFNSKPIFHNEAKGIWFESSWWWFGYWRMHFEYDLTQKIAWTIGNSGDIISVISEAMGDHPLAFSTQFISSIVSLGGFIWDKIPRLSLHFYLLAIVFIQPW